MKSLAIIFSLIISLLIGGSLYTPFRSNLKVGDISFVSMDAKKEAFKIITNTRILPNTEVHFTDSEWNGNRFGADESNIIWNSGKDTIEIGRVIVFSKLDITPTVSVGSIQNRLRISKKKDAIFAYQGSARLPQQFIAVISNHKEAYGTLINTGLDEANATLAYQQR